MKVDTPFYTGTVGAMSIKNLLFDLIIGNVPRAKKPNNPNPEWGVLTVPATREHEGDREDPKSIKVKKMTSKLAVNKEDLINVN